MEYKIINKEERSRFETQIEGEYAYIDYRFYKGAIVLLHTFVPVAYRNQGIASSLARFALEYVKKEGLQLKVYCPEVAKYIERHPEYKVLEMRGEL